MLDQIKKDMISSMKDHDKFKLTTIKMLKAAIDLERINKKQELTDEEIIKIITKQIKTRNDAIIEFERAHRDDLVLANKQEIDILKTYLPPMLSSDEINTIIKEALDMVKPTSMKDMGSVLKEISLKTNGRADMKEINTIIKDRLSNL